SSYAPTGVLHHQYASCGAPISGGRPPIPRLHAPRYREETRERSHMSEMSRIALVEDHALIALGFRDLVEASEGISLAGMVETVDGLAALDGPLDLVVLDLRLSDGSLPEENVARIHDTVTP